MTKKLFNITLISMCMMMYSCAGNRSMDDNKYGDYIEQPEYQDEQINEKDLDNVEKMFNSETEEAEKPKEAIAEPSNTIYFGFDQQNITPKAMEAIKDQVNFINSNTLENEKISITLSGHCDERGTREYNLGLGQKRANSVKNELVKLGMSPYSINTSTYGKERPEVKNAVSNEEHALNRRVVVSFATYQV